MPPKIKVTKQEIVNAAVEIVRQNGADAINARTLATMLNCSTQPIFSNFANMDDLRFAVVERADALCSEYTQREINSGKYPAYKASGMAYIRFAKEERELFKLLYMRDRKGEEISEGEGLTDEMTELIQNNTGLAGGEAQLFHLEMWAYVHGIATMFATGFLDLDWELVSKTITDVYRGLRKQYNLE